MQLKCFNIKYSLVIAWAILFCGLVSCDSNEDAASSKVVLESFGPSGVKHGESIKFIGLNLDKVMSIEFVGVTVDKGSFSSQASGLIELIVPEATEEGKIILKTPDGDIISKSILSFDVAVTIESVPEEAKPGETITITGEFVNWITSIRFTDGVVLDEFVSKSADELVLVVPMEAQTGFLDFYIGGTTPVTFKSEEELIVTLPAVTGISPASAKHTDNISLTGTDLDLVTSITFAGNQVASDFESQTEGEIVVKVPVGTVAGKLVLHQASPVDVTTAASLTIILPAGTNLAPKPAIPGTDNITITGTNLDLVAELKLSGVANAILANQFVSQSATQIVLALPATATNGAVGYKTIHGYSNTNMGVSVLIPTAGPLPLALPVYDDAILFGGGNWSWSGTSDVGSTEQVYSGTKSWKFVTPSDGGASVGGMTGVNANTLTYFSFSVYGGPGTNGKNIACILNDNWGNYNAVAIVEGQWKEFKVPLTSYPGVDKANITRWIFKVEGMPGGSTVYIDRVGFD